MPTGQRLTRKKDLARITFEVPSTWTVTENVALFVKFLRIFNRVNCLT